jgi:hypothetical protein
MDGWMSIVRSPSIDTSTGTLTPSTLHSGIFFFVGPLLLTLTVIFEWIMGNFFSMVSPK